jgi:tetratricopeptide (TPR) repeat protein
MTNSNDTGSSTFEGRSNEPRVRETSDHRPVRAESAGVNEQPFCPDQVPSGTRAFLLVCLLLTSVTVACYWPITRNNFVSIDDPDYLTGNSHVVGGLSWSGFVWAFKSTEASNWHPLTWLSHMADCELYGLNPAGHHLTNLLLHTLSSLLLFLLFNQMTGSVWRSATVAALFALHPLHVESVAWASERKDVLSGFFCIATLMSYVNYTRRPSRPKYTVTLLLFALGLMAKPMLVTLPFVLLLLDYWPLRRLSLPALHSSIHSTLRFGIASPPEPWTASSLRLLLEKLPFFGLALIASTVTYLVQKTGGAVSSLMVVPLPSRVANAVVAYVAYTAKTAWPSHLAVVYPHTVHLPIAGVVGAALLLVLLTAIFTLAAVRYPYLLVGWLWFLGTLVPTIGLVQVGSQSMADRYMYLPGIGLFVMLAWGVTDLLKGRPFGRFVLTLAGFGAVAVCAACTLTQIGYWHDSEKLYRHAMEVTSDNYLAYDGLGSALAGQGRGSEALAMCRQSVRLMPSFAQGQYNLGTVLMKQGDLEGAVEHLTLAVQIYPAFAEAHINLGQAFFRQGRLKEAEAHLAMAPALVPDYPDAQYNLGTALLKQGRTGEAIEHLSRALRLRPDSAEVHANLGVALMALGKPADGLGHLREAVRLDPANMETSCNLGIALLESKLAQEAAERFSQILSLNPDIPSARYFLALALARQQKMQEAIFHAERARDLARNAGQQDLATKAESLRRACVQGGPLP